MAAAAVLIAIWLLLPRIACAIANTTLPRELSSQATVLSLAPHCDRLPQPQIHLAMAPSLMRTIAAEASGRWIPPGVISHGFGVIGSLRGEGGTTISWHAVAIDGTTPPRLVIALTPDEINALIASAGGNRAKAAGFRLTPRITTAELSELPDDGPGRRFRLEAAGDLRLHGNGISIDVPVRRLSARIEIEFLPAPLGWEPQLRIALDAIDAPLPRLPGVDDAAWRSLLATAAEDRISDLVSGRTLPAWFPTDLRISAVVR